MWCTVVWSVQGHIHLWPEHSHSTVYLLMSSKILFHSILNHSAVPWCWKSIQTQGSICQTSNFKFQKFYFIISGVPEPVHPHQCSLCLLKYLRLDDFRNCYILNNTISVCFYVYLTRPSTQPQHFLLWITDPWRFSSTEKSYLKSSRNLWVGLLGEYYYTYSVGHTMQKQTQRIETLLVYAQQFLLDFECLNGRTS